LKIWVQASDAFYEKAVADLVRIFFPRSEIARITNEVSVNEVSVLEDSMAEEKIFDEEEVVLSFLENLEIQETQEWSVAVNLRVNGREFLVKARIKDADTSEDVVNLRRRIIRRITLQVLEEATGNSAGPWGILTGIRPTKVVHRRFDQGWSPEQIKEELVQEYALDQTKAQLLVEVAQRQRSFLRIGSDSRRWVSVYVGIPFCPSRCLYCSFPSYTLPRKGNLVESFLKALLQEIQRVGAELKRRDFRVQSIYVGGGTPTSLCPEQLRTLLSALKYNLPGYSSDQWPQLGFGEFTVEAGRPDTMDMERLQVMKDSGVNRLSINPQTMQDRTLTMIGRRHTAQEIIEVYKMARAMGFSCINMDIILGLPGETSKDVLRTLEVLAQLQPENISVHTLAVKRASRLNEEREKWQLPEDQEAEEMLRISQEVTASLGMHPYYLYRQKNILGNLENVGYSLPGWESTYNIQVMEERQTIIGLGAGAGSKWCNPQDWTLRNTYNPKDPQNYFERIEEILGKKIDRIRGLG
jgi:oxygen-independent coproporphyrinogen-3 oxidase